MFALRFFTAVAGAFWCFFSRARALRIGANSTYVPSEIDVFKMRFFNKTMKSSNFLSKSRGSRVTCALYTAGVDNSRGSGKGPLDVYGSGSPPEPPPGPQLTPKGLPTHPQQYSKTVTKSKETTKPLYDFINPRNPHEL